MCSCNTEGRHRGARNSGTGNMTESTCKLHAGSPKVSQMSLRTNMELTRWLTKRTKPDQPPGVKFGMKSIQLRDKETVSRPDNRLRAWAMFGQTPVGGRLCSREAAPRNQCQSLFPNRLRESSVRKLEAFRWQSRRAPDCGEHGVSRGDRLQGLRKPTCAEVRRAHSRKRTKHGVRCLQVRDAVYISTYIYMFVFCMALGRLQFKYPSNDGQRHADHYVA